MAEVSKTYTATKGSRNNLKATWSNSQQKWITFNESNQATVAEQDVPAFDACVLAEKAT